MDLTAHLIAMKCKICELRKARRYCPGVGGDICPVCCGNEREVTIDCPRDCPYLVEARAHERFVPFDPNTRLFPEIKLEDKFLHEHQEVMAWIGLGLYAAVEANPRSVDIDMREALEALAKSYRTLINGIVYEPRPVNPFAARIFDHVQDSINQFRKEGGSVGQRLRDSEALAMLVLFVRLSWDYNNGRPKGRPFLDLINSQFKGTAGAVRETPRLIEL